MALSPEITAELNENNRKLRAAIAEIKDVTPATLYSLSNWKTERMTEYGRQIAENEKNGEPEKTADLFVQIADEVQKIAAIMFLEWVNYHETRESLPGLAAALIADFLAAPIEHYESDWKRYRAGEVIRNFKYQSQKAERAAKLEKRITALAAKGLEPCDRCGGAGGWKGWPGFTCYKCNGSGTQKLHKAK